MRSRVNALIESAPDSYSDVLAGALAGAFAAALTTPLDVLVTHTLTNDVDGCEHGLQQAAKSAQQLVSEQGPGTLMRGVGLRTLYYAPSVGCFFGLYEYFRRTFEGGL
jgi:solute carrier family 25 S-adenosylmethionine transporter 26